MPEGISHVESYEELCAAVGATLHRTDMRASIPQWVAAAELEIFRDCDIRPADQVKTGTIAASSGVIPVPAGAFDIRHIELGTTPGVTLRLADLDQIRKKRENNTAGPPLYFAVVGDEIWLGPSNGDSGSIAYTMVYYGQPEPLSEENPTNALLRLGWDAYLYGALFHASPHIGADARIPTWTAYWATKKESLKLAYWRSRSAGVLTTRPDVETRDQYSGRH